MNEGDEIDPRKVKVGTMLVGAVTVLAIVLALAINDASARFVFGFVAVAGLVQTWRIRRHSGSLE